MNYPYVAKRGGKPAPNLLAFGALFIVAIFGVFLFSYANQPTPQPNQHQYGAFNQQLDPTPTMEAHTTYQPYILTATHIVREATQTANGALPPVEQTANAILNDAQATVDAIRQMGILPSTIDPVILNAANQLVFSLFNYHAHIQAIQQATIPGGTEATGGRYIDIVLTDGSALLTRKMGDELIMYAYQLPTGLVTYFNASEGEGIYQQRQGLPAEILYINDGVNPNFIPTIAPPLHNFMPTVPPFGMLATPTPFPYQFPATATPLPGAGS